MYSIRKGSFFCRFFSKNSYNLFTGITGQSQPHFGFTTFYGKLGLSSYFAPNRLSMCEETAEIESRTAPPKSYVLYSTTKAALKVLKGAILLTT